MSISWYGTSIYNVDFDSQQADFDANPVNSSPVLLLLKYLELVRYRSNVKLECVNIIF